MLDAVWSGARGWLTPPVLFVFVNIVIGTIAVMSKLMSSSAAAGDQRRSLMRAPSAAFDRLRCFSFSRLGMSPEHHAAAAVYEQQYSALDDGAAAEATTSVYPAPDGGEWRRMSLLRRAPSVALDRLRGFSFSRRGPAAADHAPATPPSDSAADDAAPSPLRQAPAVEKMEREREHEHQAGIERSQSEAAAVEAPARRRPRGKKTRMSGREPRADGHGTGEAAATGRREMLLPPAVEVDARADDFIRQFREELRLQRIDSILRYKDTLRRTGTV